MGQQMVHGVAAVMLSGGCYKCMKYYDKRDLHLQSCCCYGC